MLLLANNTVRRIISGDRLHQTPLVFCVLIKYYRSTWWIVSPAQQGHPSVSRSSGKWSGLKVFGEILTPHQIIKKTKSGLFEWKLLSLKTHEFTPTFHSPSPQPSLTTRDPASFSLCCLSQAHRCPSDEGSGMQKQPGPAEALKQMLFRLQAVEAELQRQNLSPGASAANQKKEYKVLTNVRAIWPQEKIT